MEWDDIFNLENFEKLLGIIFALLVFFMLVGFFEIINQEDKKENQLIYNYCKTHKVIKTWNKVSDVSIRTSKHFSQNRNNYFVEFEDGKVVEVSEENFPKYIEGQTCK